MAEDTANVWEDAELQINADPFCTSCKISSINKKARSKVPLKPKSPFTWVFMDVIPATSPKSLTNDTNFKNYLLLVDAYSKLPKLYGMKNITTEEVLDKLDIFSVQIWQNRPIWLVGFGENFSRCRNSVYLNEV